MRDGYTPDELDKLESLMDRLPHVQGMFWAGDTGWEHIISELHAIVMECAKRRGDESQRKLNEAGGDMRLLSAQEAIRGLRAHWDNGASRGTSLTKLESVDISHVAEHSHRTGETAHVTGPGHISPSEQPFQHYVGEGYQGSVKFTLDSPQVTPVINPEDIAVIFADGIADGFVPNWKEIISDQLEQEMAMQDGVLYICEDDDTQGGTLQVGSEFIPADRLAAVRGIDVAKHGADKSVVGFHNCTVHGSRKNFLIDESYTFDEGYTFQPVYPPSEWPPDRTTGTFSDPIMEIQCAFCSQLSLKRVTPDVNWCCKCGTVTIGEGLERYCQAPELAMETQASIKATNDLLDEQESHAERLRKTRDDLIVIRGKNPSPHPTSALTRYD